MTKANKLDHPKPSRRGPDYREPECRGLDHREPDQSRIILGDVLDVLDSLGTQAKFDVVIADPPYNIGKNFGNNDDQMELADYVAWSQQWLDRCFDVLEDHGLIYVYGFPEILSHLAVKFPVGEQRWLVWHYTNKAVPSSKFWQRSHESILCLWKPGNRRPALEVDQIRVPYTSNYLKCAGRERAATASRFGGKNGRVTTYRAHANGALPRDVISVPALAGGAGAVERWFLCRDCGDRVFSPSETGEHKSHDVLKHPTQKPMELTRQLLLSRIEGPRIEGQGGSVLIPFAGSGSECVVARDLGANFLGIEMNPEFVALANGWLQHPLTDSEQLESEMLCIA